MQLLTRALGIPQSSAQVSAVLAPSSATFPAAHHPDTCRAVPYPQNLGNLQLPVASLPFRKQGHLQTLSVSTLRGLLPVYSSSRVLLLHGRECHQLLLHCNRGSLLLVIKMFSLSIPVQLPWFLYCRRTFPSATSLPALCSWLCLCRVREHLAKCPDSPVPQGPFLQLFVWL